MTITFTRISSYQANGGSRRAIEVRDDNGRVVHVSLRQPYETEGAWVVRAGREAR